VPFSFHSSYEVRSSPPPRRRNKLCNSEQSRTRCYWEDLSPPLPEIVTRQPLLIGCLSLMDAAGPSHHLQLYHHSNFSLE